VRYKHEHLLSNERIGAALGISKGTVHNILERFSSSGLVWPLPEGLRDTQLEAALYERGPGPEPGVALPDMEYIERELHRPHVTLQLLFEEYHEAHPDALGRTAFYRYVRKHLPRKPDMRGIHKGGDKLFIDYSGDGLEYVERSTGEIVSVELFVCAWGASSYCYAEATHTQNSDHFVGSHVRALEYFEAVPAALVPDNLKSGVHKASRYDPTLNELYRKMAEYYGTVVLPARVAAPKDKATVESSVLHVQRFILARLRNRTFFSLAEINEAIRELLELLNTRGMKDYGNRSRRERFRELDQPYAKPLPKRRFTIGRIKEGVLVGRNYHIRYRDRYYSVPYPLVGQRVDVHQVGPMLELYHDNHHVCRHLIHPRKFAYTTVQGHMPPEHTFVRGWSKEYFIKEGAKVGAATARAVEATMKRQQHVQQGFNAALGILRLAKIHTPQRLEKACERALYFSSPTYRCIKSILQQHLDEQPLQAVTTTEQLPVQSHDNLRGADYYTQTTLLER
jgi:transposase